MSEGNKKFVRLSGRESGLLALLGLIIAMFFGIIFLVVIFDSRSFAHPEKLFDLISLSGYSLAGLMLLRSSYKGRIENWAYDEKRAEGKDSPSENDSSIRQAQRVKRKSNNPNFEALNVPKLSFEEICEISICSATSKYKVKKSSGFEENDCEKPDDKEPHVHTFFDGRLQFYVGDITEEAVDVVVNAANSMLLGGGGVDGAIHRRGGGSVTAACRQVRLMDYPNGLPTGQAVITTAGDLPAQRIIHTVGPIFGRHGGHEAELLADCYRNALLLAREKGLKTIAFPAISTGVYGYPVAAAAAVVGQTLRAFLADDTHFEEIRLVFFTERDLQEFLAHWQ